MEYSRFQLVWFLSAVVTVIVSLLEIIKNIQVLKLFICKSQQLFHPCKTCTLLGSKCEYNQAFRKIWFTCVCTYYNTHIGIKTLEQGINRLHVTRYP